MVKRVFLIVLDSLGIGALPDAKAYGDEGSNTLRSIMQSKHFKAETLTSLGLFNIDGVDGEKSSNPKASYARLKEKSLGKDTTVGHWEIAGIISEKPFPTYPKGFPEIIIKPFIQKTGRKILCNKPYSGTEVILDYGREHMESGKLIVYTSADSVFQIAAHEEVVSLFDLMKYSAIARKMLKGEHAVARVIARPFKGEYPDFIRTANRQDFSVEPPLNTMLDTLKSNNFDVLAVGKINDIFAGKGITEAYSSKSNFEGMKITTELLTRDFTGICFVNLVDFDMLYGHRNDVEGYAMALADCDIMLKDFISKMAKDDVLIITADHGCDPSTPSTDHSREYAPMLIYGERIKSGVNLNTRESFSDIAASILECFMLPQETEGKSFFKKVYNG